MNRFFYPGAIRDERVSLLDAEEIKHIERVLRLKAGDQVELCDVNGQVYIAAIESIQKKEVCLRCLNTDHTQRELPFVIDVFQGLPKASKMDLIIQKSVELGAHAIRPVEFIRSVSRIKDADTGKVERWQKIADEASKQAKRNKRTTIEKPIQGKAIADFLVDYDLILLAYERSEVKLSTVLKDIKPYRIAVIIGPEGGFDAEEVQSLIACGAKSISLGPRILRTETAALTVLSVLAYQYD